MSAGGSAGTGRRTNHDLRWLAIGGFAAGLLVGALQPLIVVVVGPGIYGGPTGTGVLFLLCLAAVLLLGLTAVFVRASRDLAVPVVTLSGCLALGMLGGNLVASRLDIGFATPRAPTTPHPTGQGWATTGSLLTGRSDHTATTLLDGRLLAAGGMGVNEHRLSSAELYDAGTGTWSPTRTMAVPRMDHLAVRLTDGRVFVISGNGAGELYDPEPGTWSLTAAMRLQRTGFAATLLRDGRVLVSGGRNPAIGSDSELPSAELYDPTTGAWSDTRPMRVARTSHTATLLPDGRVLVAGGQGSTTSEANPVGFLKAVEIFAPTTGKWIDAPAMQWRHSGHAAVLLADGRVFVSGSSVDGSGVELFDAVARRWAAGGSIQGWMSPEASLLADGRVLIVDASGGFEVYDPRTGASTRVANADHGFGATATLLADGRVLVAGGRLIHYGRASEFLTAAHLFDPR